MTKYNICICGGGNISHALAGILSNKGHNINIFTRQPDKWNKKITTFINVLNNNSTFESHLHKISSNPSIVIKDVDIIIIACPLMAYDDILNKIKDHLTPNMILISIPGRLFKNYINKHNITNNIITFLRTPYICSIEDYGVSVNISGFVYDKINYWANFEESNIILNQLFDFNNHKLNNHLSIDLVNSNLLLHSCRLYILFDGNKYYEDKPLFYKNWCLESSELLIICDKELHDLINKINDINNENFDNNNQIFVKDILTHYESFDKISLTNKINSISAFPERSPVIFKNNKYYADINHRYFQEEIIALKFVIDLSKQHNINIPNIEKMYNSFIYLQENFDI